jgi:hypothetical protein
MNTKNVENKRETGIIKTLRKSGRDIVRARRHFISRGEKS